MGLWNRISSAVSSGWNKARNGIGQAVNNVKSGIGNVYNSTKQGLKKGWQATKDLASKHADTIGGLAAKAVSVAAPALDAYLGVPVGSILQSGAKKLAKHYAKDDTGWGRFAKGFANTSSKSNLSSQLNSQSNATNESNGHVAAGYTVSSTGNYNGLNRKKSWFQG